jgi:hypothetical protein
LRQTAAGLRPCCCGDIRRRGNCEQHNRQPRAYESRQHPLPPRRTAADKREEPTNEPDPGPRVRRTIAPLGFLPEAHRHLPHLRLAGDDIGQHRAEAIRRSFGELRSSPLRILAPPGRLVRSAHSRLGATVCLAWDCADFCGPHSVSSRYDVLRLCLNLRTSTGLTGEGFCFLPRRVCLTFGSRA